MYIQSNRDILALSFTSNKSNGDRGFDLLNQIHHQDLNLVVIDCVGKTERCHKCKNVEKKLLISTNQPTLMEYSNSF